MGRRKLPHDATCKVCGQPYRRGPARCPECKKGKQGKGLAPNRTSTVCPACGESKSASSVLCAACRRIADAKNWK